MHDIQTRVNNLVAKVSDKKFKVFSTPDFDKPAKVRQFIKNMPRLEEFNQKRKELRELKATNVPAELLAFYQEPLLDHEQEVHEFRRFNCHKHLARKIVAKMKEPTERLVAKAEDHIVQAEKARHQLVCSNTRLAAQILRKRSDFYRAHSLTSDLLSDAFLNVVKAVECFDWTRGFKFSTYATWVLMNNFTRDMAGERTFNERFVTGFDDTIYDTRLDTSDEDCRDKSESLELMTKNVGRLLDLFDSEDNRQRYVIEEWFGLKNGGKRTLKAISSDLKLTKERVRQLRESGMNYLRECVESGEVKIE